MPTISTQTASAKSTAALVERSEELVERAKGELRKRSGSLAELLGLGKLLKDAGLFDLACRVLTLAREQRTSDDKVRHLLAQQLALCTYKNPDIPLSDRLDAALNILEDDIDLRSTTDQESLGIVGAIYKRKWQADGGKEHLETSYKYYRRGFDQGVDNDFGYTAINAACVLDLLATIEAQQAARTGSDATLSSTRRTEAASIRKAIVTALLARRATNPDAFDASWWKVATLAEAYFGLEDFSNAAQWLRTARAIPEVPRWQLDSTAQQLATLARLQSKAQIARHTTGDVRTDPLGDPEPLTDSPAWKVLQEFVGVPAAVINSAALGRVGLALSGGGFRAALFHIGVLAALAEHDLLRHVEVISCVSGGSIIGAHYYLELKRLLESRADGDITAADYVEIVGRLEKDFLAGVQQNIRMRVFENLVDNWRMFFSQHFSRTQKVGELYERYIYSRIKRDDAAAPDAARFIDDLQIQPAAVDAGLFHPRWDNWRRAAKVPSLIVNASSLNSGHQWQFTASFMGEPPSIINTKVDANYRLRRMYYKQAPAGYKRVRMGHAIGASSCVPGLFEPLQFRNLFPDIAVTLADGGVHDNQGILSLFEQDCDNLIISDASGQVPESDTPAVGALSVLYRSDNVFQARMRDLQFRDLTARIRGGVVSATYMHLKQGLDVTAKDWIGCDDPKENPAATTKAVQFTTYDVRKDVQRLLAVVRTDLDSFCDAEAHALMNSGYKMTTRNLQERRLGASRTPHDWNFLYIDEAMRRGDPRLMAILRQSSSLGFKVWGLLPSLRIIGRTLLILAFVAAAITAWRTQNDPVPFFTLGGLLFSGIVLALTAALGPLIGRILNAPGWPRRAAIGVGAGIFGWIVTFVHLRWFDRWYLAYGSRNKFRAPQ